MARESLSNASAFGALLRRRFEYCSALEIQLIDSLTDSRSRCAALRSYSTRQKTDRRYAHFFCRSFSCRLRTLCHISRLARRIARSPRISMGPHRSSWLSMDPHRNLCRSLWICTDLHGLPRISLDFHVFSCVSATISGDDGREWKLTKRLYKGERGLYA